MKATPLVAVLAILALSCSSGVSTGDDVLRIINSGDQANIGFTYGYTPLKGSAVAPQTVMLRTDNPPGSETLLKVTLLDSTEFNFTATLAGVSGSQNCTVSSAGEAQEAVDVLVWFDGAGMVIDCADGWY